MASWINPYSGLTPNQVKRVAIFLFGLGGLYMLGTGLYNLVPPMVQYFALVTGRVWHLHYVHTLITYPVIHTGLEHWAQLVLPTAVLLPIVVPRFRTTDIVVGLFSSAIIVGTLFVLTFDGTAVLVGAAPPTWGLAGAALGCWLKNWRSFRFLEHITSLTIIGVIAAGLVGSSELDRAGAVFAVMAMGGALWRAAREDSAKHRRPHTLMESSQESGTSDHLCDGLLSRDQGGPS